jgi:hypothetical protein
MRIPSANLNFHDEEFAMAEPVRDLKAWIDTLDPKGAVTIGKDGLTLVELTKDGAETGAYLELGCIMEKPPEENA